MSDILKNYQHKVVNQLLDYTNLTLKYENNNKTIVLQSPTGSGKTFMLASYIERLCNENKEESFCFIWISIGTGNLHVQSYNSVKNKLKGYPNCSLLEKDYFGSKKSVFPNEVVFLNWEKINSKNTDGTWKNNLMMDKETNNLIDVLENTRSNGLKIILIIDESHMSTNSARAIELRDEIIKPSLTIEMSATPIISDLDFKIQVDPFSVIEEGMIKKQVLINPDIDSDTISDNEIDSQTLVMEFAYNKREELVANFKQELSIVNPLVLIQIPNTEAGQDKLDFVIDFLSNKGINEQNGKLGIWLSDVPKNFNQDDIKRLNHEMSFLVFKQAVSTGWDCPRAHILVRFREIRSFPFEVQTVGRILRTPEAMHYDNDTLNTAYVYTNLKSIDVKKETYNPNIIKSLKSVRRDNVENITLTSYYRSRGGLFNDIDASFYPIFEEVFLEKTGFTKDTRFLYQVNQESLKNNNLDIFDFNLSDTMIGETKVSTEAIDKDQHIESVNPIFTNYSDNDLQYAYESIIVDNLNGLAKVRSLSPVKMSIAKVFSDYLDINPRENNGMKRIQSIIVYYKDFYSELLDQSIKRYKTKKEEKFSKNYNEVKNDSWEIEKIKMYNSGSVIEKKSNLSIYQPLYLMSKESNGQVVPANQLELDFIDYIEGNSTSIDWFWQNGAEHMETNFGIPYIDENDNLRTFQPDFIIKFSDGRIGIFDTKPIDHNVEDTTVKSNALTQYINEQTIKGKNIIGGIVVKSGNHFYINQNKNGNYRDYKVSPEDWLYFSTILKND